MPNWIYPVLALIAVLLVLFCLVLLWLGPYLLIAKPRKHPHAMDIQSLCVISLICPVLWPVALVWAYAGSDPPGRRKHATLANRNFDESFAPKEVISRYRVIGVDRDSGLDTELVMEGMSEANVKAKAELKGIIVTEVKISLDKAQ